MRFFFLKPLISVLTRSSILVGGQAVINGVMMRVPGAYSTAVRKDDGSIQFNSISFTPLSEKNKIFKLPIIRGAIGLYEAMKIGYSTLNWSAAISEESSDKKTNPIIESLINLFAIILAITIFMFLPIYLAEQLYNDSPIIFNIIAGSIRICIFLTYLILISRLKDVQVLFQYHGAEHKTIFTFENGSELLYENTKKYKKEHPRCGTSFLFIVMIVAILSFSIIDAAVIQVFSLEKLETIQRLLLHIICFPLVSGISYEILKILAKNMDKNYIIKLLCKPGLLLQKITTKEPSEEQLEVAFEALKTAFGDKYNLVKGKKYKADAIG